MSYRVDEPGEGWKTDRGEKHVWNSSGAPASLLWLWVLDVEATNPSLRPWQFAPSESISELRRCFHDFIKNATKTHALRYATSVLSGAFLLDGSIF